MHGFTNTFINLFRNKGRNLLIAGIAFVIVTLVVTFFVINKATANDKMIVQDLSTYLGRLSAEDQFSGTALFAKGGNIIFEQAYGYADSASKVPNNMNTKYNLASVTKTLTATAVLQLAQAGKLSVDDTLLKLVPDYPNKDIANKITVKQLLTMTSGIDEYVSQTYMENPANYQTLKSYLPLFSDKSLLFEPGTKTVYSNTGYLLLGLIVEYVSGQDYFSYIHDHIFEPAGMKDSVFYPAPDGIENLANAYTRPIGSPSSVSREVPDRSSNGNPATGCYSTVHDLLAFSEALLHHKLLNTEYTDKFFSGELIYSGNLLNSGAFQMNGVSLLSVSGSTNGVNNDLSIYKESGYTTVILSNYDNGANLVRSRLHQMITGQDLPEVIKLPDSNLKQFEGKYKTPSPQAKSGAMVLGGKIEFPPIEVTAKNGDLQVDLGRSGMHDFVPLSSTEFFDYGDPDSRLTFTKDNNGNITGLTIKGGQINISAPKLTNPDEDSPTQSEGRITVQPGDSNSTPGNGSPSLGTISVPARMKETEAITALKNQSEKEAAENQFSGTIMVSKNGNRIFEAAYGYANIENKVENELDTKFNIGSMGKMFTGTSVMQMVQAGKVNLDDTLGKYLPDYPNKEVAKVTIDQLLTHTAGTGNIFGSEELNIFNDNRLELKDPKDYIALFGERGLRFEPGSKWEYSNYGYILLGRIIEVVSGESYYDYVRENIFKPAGMDTTDNYLFNEKAQKVATGYTKLAPGERLPSGLVTTKPDFSGPLRSNEDTLLYRGGPAGGGYSTVGDLVRFADAITSHKLLNTYYTELLITGKVNTPMPGSKCGYGFSVEMSQDGIISFGHNGGAPGINGQLIIFPELDYVVAVLGNLDPPAAQTLAQFISVRLPVE